MKNLILILGVIISMYSCEKSDKPEKTANPVSEYLPMTVGNYWVYQVFDINSGGNEFQTSIMDSTIITKDTLINDLKYFRFDFYENSIHPVATIYFRDSLKNLVNSAGEILFSENNFTDILLRKSEILQEDTIYSMTCSMEKIGLEVSVPAGVFNNILNYKGTVVCNPKYTTIENPRYTNKYYARGTGPIFQSQIYVSGGGVREKRLVRYHINN